MCIAPYLLSDLSCPRAGHLVRHESTTQRQCQFGAKLLDSALHEHARSKRPATCKYAINGLKKTHCLRGVEVLVRGSKLSEKAGKSTTALDICIFLAMIQCKCYFPRCLSGRRIQCMKPTICSEHRNTYTSFLQSQKRPVKLIERKGQRRNGCEHLRRNASTERTS